MIEKKEFRVLRNSEIDNVHGCLVPFMVMFLGAGVLGSLLAAAGGGIAAGVMRSRRRRR